MLLRIVMGNWRRGLLTRIAGEKAWWELLETDVLLVEYSICGFYFLGVCVIDFHLLTIILYDFIIVNFWSFSKCWRVSSRLSSLEIGGNKICVALPRYPQQGMQPISRWTPPTSVCSLRRADHRSVAPVAAVINLRCERTATRSFPATRKSRRRLRNNCNYAETLQVTRNLERFPRWSFDYDRTLGYREIFATK